MSICSTSLSNCTSWRVFVWGARTAHHSYIHSYILSASLPPALAARPPLSSIRPPPTYSHNNNNNNKQNNVNNRHDVATKVIGGKLLSGFALTHVQCDRCEMPLMERNAVYECVVCPTLTERAAEEAGRKRADARGEA